jgi:hypothetical protein
MKRFIILFLLLIFAVASPSFATMTYYGSMFFNSNTETTEIWTAAQEEAGYLTWDSVTGRTKIYLDPSIVGGGGGSMTWPSGGAGIPNYNGSSGWGSTYSFRTSLRTSANSDNTSVVSEHGIAVALQSYAPAFTSGTQNYFWATPNGSSGVPSLRAIVAADIPTLNQSTSGTAGNLSGPAETSNTRKFLRELSVAGVFQTPAWDTLQAADIPALSYAPVSGSANYQATLACTSGYPVLGTGQCGGAALGTGAYATIGNYGSLGGSNTWTGSNDFSGATSFKIRGGTAAEEGYELD